MKSVCSSDISLSNPLFSASLDRLCIFNAGSSKTLLIGFEHLFNDLMTHKAYIKESLGFKHSLSSLKVIVCKFNPIFYLILLHLKYTFSKYNLFFTIYNLSA